MKKITWVAFRLFMSGMFLWPFVDKMFGLGFATKPENAWIKGASPTTGFLNNGTHGPFADFFQGLVGLGFSGINIIDWLFMLGLLGVGLTLLFNRFVVFGAVVGSLIMFLIYLSVFPPVNNPLLDDHLLQIFALILIAFKSRERY